MLAKYYGNDDLAEGLPPNFTHDAELPPKPYSMVHILTTQGHPEWSAEIINPLVDEFLKDGKIDEDLARNAKQHTQNEDDAQVFGRAMMRVMGVAWSETHEAAEKKGDK